MPRSLCLSWFCVYTRRWLSSITVDYGAERDIISLRYVCLFGAGVIGYFTIPAEPECFDVVVVGLICATSLFCLYRSRGHLTSCISFGNVFVLACGFLYAYGVAFSLVDGSFPTYVTVHQKPVSLTGRVIRIVPLVSGHRVTFDSVAIQGTKPITPSSRVRLVIKSTFNFQPGQVLELRAVLRSPSAPVVPGGYDFQRYAWFEKIKAVGYAISLPQIVSEVPLTPSLIGIEQIRNLIGERFRTAAPGDQGAVAAALITGERQAISAQLTAAYRNAGLAHLLAISGLNIGIYASLVFIIFRRGLAFIPAICLRWPIKKVAAALAFGATTFYLLISGAEVPAQRSWIMSSCVLVAVMLDRHAITLRTFSFAAFFACLWNPSSLLGPSFQMSFAAVLALVSGYTRMNPLLLQWQQRAPTPTHAILRALGRYFLGIILSTVFSTLATAPYTLYHFHGLSLYGLLANLIAVPLTALWVMPGLILALFLMLFDLEKAVLIPLGWGLDCIAAVARTVSNLPYAHLYSPPMSPYALLIATGTGTWLCLCQKRWRGIACFLFLCALASPWIVSERPTFIMNSQGTLVAVSNKDGLTLSPGRRDRFTRRSWTERWKHSTHSWPYAEGLYCRTSHCQLDRAGRTLVFAKTHKALSNYCTNADILVTPIVINPTQIPLSCRKAQIIDGRSLQTNGTYAIYMTKHGVRTESSRAYQGDRLWSAYSEP